MVSGSQLQVAKLAQMCPVVPSIAQRRPGSKPGRPTALNSADQCFFRAHHPFYVLFKKKESKDLIFRIIRPESRGPQGALGGLI